MHRRLLRPTPRMRRVRRESTSHSPRLWLFDLDNTLHDASHSIFSRIDQAMTAAVALALGLETTDAREICLQYWKKYGATVIGMARHHGVDVHAFLKHSHDFDLKPLINAKAGLAAKLRRLPGRKVLLTNAPFEYARKVLQHLGILNQFDSLWALEHMRLQGQFCPKPSMRLLRYVLAREGVACQNAVLVEDTLVNLRSARRAGLRTVYVFHPKTPFSQGTGGRPSYVDLRVNCVTDLLLQRRLLR